MKTMIQPGSAPQNRVLAEKTFQLARALRKKGANNIFLAT